MRRCFALGLAATLTAASWLQPAAAQTAGTYPASRSNADIAAWLRRDTPLDPAKVVDISPSSITEVSSFEPTSQPVGFIAILHAEALDATIEKEEGILSWAIPVELDCPAHKVRLGAMTGFPGRDIRYGSKPIRGADDDWVAPAPKAPLDNVLRALCERGFQHPLAGVSVATQAAPAPTRSPPPAAAAPPVQPAPAAARPSETPPAAPARPTVQAAAPIRSGATVSIAVQVGATPDAAEAKGILNRVQARFAGDLKDLKTDIVTVTLKGKTVYRVLISGFHAAAEANRLCATLKSGGHACFVRG